MNAKINPISKIRGEIGVPGDKSMSHRAVVFGSISEGETRISGFLKSDDCLRTINAFKLMGIEISEDSTGKIILQGKGLRGLKEPADIIDCGNSGTTMRLLAGLLSGQNFMSILTGDNSLRSRPMNRIITPLREMGTMILGRNNNNYPPIAISGNPDLRNIEYTLPVASAQVKSAIILASLYTNGRTVIVENIPTRDHTENMLHYFNGKIHKIKENILVDNPSLLEGRNINIPGDISSGAFFISMALLAKNGDITIRNIGLNPLRTGILEVFKNMGGEIEVLKMDYGECGELIGDLHVKSSKLYGTEISGKIIPRLIDELPVFAIAAAFAEGITILKDAAELRVKETDRLKTITTGLKKMGVKIEEREDGFVIEGSKRLHGAEIDSNGDHRIAMAFIVAGLMAEGETIVRNVECIDISFPGFNNIVNNLTGMAIKLNG